MMIGGGTGGAGNTGNSSSGSGSSNVNKDLNVALFYSLV